ncbi:MAG: bifunctional UDP-N-acetylglucosamine diphosphorylase/glucosamine-1-phosphate N-acetyltransferase GlmU [Rhodocyclaceae bacterium]|nr:bifunctional UDP-N-acetylglucosamine diphosphorylase/glucosamine-1-phosphate N-acetyltransferase GlmU [Rhodocyclaceae bacterium]MBX3669009.1 bifunctional UDP-N-acetylglucosamine diphosphorylase/glucosamine-1-phosphate N-acetyltransferase GlmU [Rhodocyclaceae bacterium]
MQVVILAAGQGKRMNSRLPKVLQPLAGLPLLGHVVTAARALSPTRLCVVIGHGGEAVRAAFPGLDCAWAVQEPQLGTGHAVAQAVPALSAEGSVLVLYGDVPLLRASTLQRLAAAAGSERLAILTVELENPAGYGRIVRDAQGRVQRIVEHKDASEAERALREVNTGIMAIPARQLERWLNSLKNDNAQGEYYLTDIVALAVAENVEVVTAAPDEAWETLGVNDKIQLAELERTYQRDQARRLMQGGVTLRDPERLDLRGELICGRDVEIDVGCVFEGRVEIADGARIGPYCQIKDSRIGSGARLLAYSVLDDAEVGALCQIGPYARLRPGTRLAEDVHVGNFVELKNTVVAARSKANHLAYLGDATIGSNVNVGAGTITCNYDGANKYRTVIEDDAFIGSDTQLVAPVTVKRGATLGAGTTLTQEAPADKLTLSRARQVTLENWKRPVKGVKK